jgi:hypothetical protein
MYGAIPKSLKDVPGTCRLNHPISHIMRANKQRVLMSADGRRPVTVVGCWLDGRLDHPIIFLATHRANLEIFNNHLGRLSRRSRSSSSQNGARSQNCPSSKWRGKQGAPFLNPVQVYRAVREMGTERDSFSFGANFHNFTSHPLLGLLSGEWPHNICIITPIIDLFLFLVDTIPYYISSTMPRSTVVSNKSKQRSSLRVKGAEPTSTEPLARARRRSPTGKSSTSSSSSSQSTNKDGPHRRLRSKSVHTDEPVNDRKPPAAVLNNATNSQAKKRSASSTKQAKRKSPRLSITAGKDDGKASLNNQVTPSPAATKASSAFTFKTPIIKKKKRTSSCLPDGVVDLYAAGCLSCACMCNQDDSSAESVTANYIRSYGKEYWQNLKDTEEPAISPSSPDSHVSRSAVFSPRSSNSSYATAETPELKRDWVYFNTSAVKASQPIESAQYLPYQPDLTPKMRSILVDWIIELSEHFNFGPTTLHLAVTLVDKVLACGPLSMTDDSDGDESGSDDEDESKTNCFLISRERFQLLGAACTWIACKIEELNPPGVDDFAYVSDNIYTTAQIKRMERRICKALHFSFWHQTPYPYSYEFIRASHECPKPDCSSSSLFNNMVLYLLELGRLPYSPVTKKPSLLAASAVYLARMTLGRHEWTPTLEYYTGYSKSELQETVLAIHAYHLAAEESSLKSVFTKYKTKKYQRVALKTVPREEDLGF